MSEEKLAEIVQQKAKEGKVVFMTVEGPLVADLEKFLKQPTEGILYDLNRDHVTVLHWMSQGEQKWANDYAVGVVIAKLKEHYDKRDRIEYLFSSIMSLAVEGPEVMERKDLLAAIAKEASEGYKLVKEGRGEG